jgi:hypothetical protein
VRLWRWVLSLFQKKQPSLKEVADDWTWRWEMQDQWQPVIFNAGTKEKPEWACLR